MKQLLDSRLEALAFNYLSFGIFTVVNNLWTWVAVITAAVSFWRIKAAGAATSSSTVKSHKQGWSTTEVEEKPTVSALASVTGTTSVSRFVCNGGVTKSGKPRLTVYYEEDIDGETTDTEWSEGDGNCTEGSCGGDRWESWERVLRLRKGETGWYRYQDLTAINGNVVRLWDGSCRRARYS